MPIIGAAVAAIIVLVLVSNSMQHQGNPHIQPALSPNPSSGPPSIQTANGYSFIKKWGANGTGDGQFNSPNDVAVDSSGNVYVADAGNDRIQKFNSNGTFITKWGSVGSNNGQFSGLTGVAVDSSGNVYVAENGNDRIQQFNSNGTFITKWGINGIAERAIQ